MCKPNTNHTSPPLQQQPFTTSCMKMSIAGNTFQSDGVDWHTGILDFIEVLRSGTADAL